jgi:hypothetical protein
MPTLVLSARICPEGVEATLYASLMSLLNFSSGVSDLLGGALTRLLGITSTKFDNLVPLMVVCNVLGLTPLLLLGLVPPENAAAAAAAAAGGGGVGGGASYQRVRTRDEEDGEAGLELVGGMAMELSREGMQNGDAAQSMAGKSPRLRWGQTH